MKKQNNILDNLTVENVAPRAKYLAKEIVETLSNAYQAGIITEQEQVWYFSQLGDPSKEAGYFYNLRKELLLKLAQHHTTNNEDLESMFQFKTVHGIIDIRPILIAINHAEGVEVLASAIDTVLFDYINGLEDISADVKLDIQALKDLRTGLLRAGKKTELASYKLRDKLRESAGEDFKHTSIHFVAHRIPSDAA